MHSDPEILQTHVKRFDPLVEGTKTPLAMKLPDVPNYIKMALEDLDCERPKFDWGYHILSPDSCSKEVVLLENRGQKNQGSNPLFLVQPF